jgi:hypothetical protein
LIEAREPLPDLRQQRAGFLARVVFLKLMLHRRKCARKK